MSNQKMKPILFSGEMVKAILAGRKTMTRRVIKNMPTFAFMYTTKELNQSNFVSEYSRIQPGNVLWVRETWRIQNYGYDSETLEYEGQELQYRADFTEDEDECYGRRGGCAPCKWKPSIHMPREAARIFLKVTDVRVERLQEITPFDAWCEGCRIGNSFSWEEHVPELQQQCRDIIFRDLWNSLNAKRDNGMYAWDMNPWVWVYEFERAEAE